MAQEPTTAVAFSPQDEATIEAYKYKIYKPVRLRLTTDNSDAANQMKAFVNKLQTHIPAISVTVEPAQDESPYIFIEPNIRFMAVATGKLLTGFLASIAGISAMEEDKAGLPAAEIRRLVQLPGIIKIYTSTGCPYCPQAVARGLYLAEALPDKCELRVIDATLFSEMAASDKIRSVPTTVLDGPFRWTGVFKIPEVVDVMVNRDPAELSAETLQKMMADGDAEGVAKLMNSHSTVIPGYLELLAHPKWPTRLGAMVVFEYLAESAPTLARQVIEAMWDRFSDLDDAVKGDILHLVGLFNDPVFNSLLQTVIDGDYSADIRHTALEIRQDMDGQDTLRSP